VTWLLSFSYPFFRSKILSFTNSNLFYLTVIPLAIIVLIEAGVLRPFYKAANVRKVLMVSTTMNLASYAIVLVNLVYLFGS